MSLLRKFFISINFDDEDEESVLKAKLNEIKTLNFQLSISFD